MIRKGKVLFFICLGLADPVGAVRLFSQPSKPYGILNHQPLYLIQSCSIREPGINYLTLENKPYQAKGREAGRINIVFVWSQNMGFSDPEY